WTGLTTRLFTARVLTARVLAARLVAIIAARPLAFTLRAVLVSRAPVVPMMVTIATVAAMLMTVLGATFVAMPAATTMLATMLALLARAIRLVGHGLRHVLVGRRRDDSDALVGQPLDALELAALAAVAERHGDARGAGARGSADAVDVALGVGRQFEVD